MQEQFHRSTLVPKSVLKSLSERSDSPATLKFIFMYSAFIFFHLFVVVAWGRPWYYQFLGYLGFAICVCSTFACEHETVHNTAFKSRAANRVAALLCGIVHVYPSQIFREFHFEHHRYTNIPGKDPEISIGGKPVPSVISSLPSYVAWVTGLPLLLFKVMMMFVGAMGSPNILRKALVPFIKEQNRIKILLDSWLVLIVNLGILYLAINVYAGFWGIFIGQVLGHCLLGIYLAMEHNGLPYEGTILEKTRSMRVGKIMKAVMWNMPYHAEHHAYPSVPFHALPRLHEVLKDDLLHKHESHFDFHSAVVRERISGKRSIGEE